MDMESETNVLKDRVDWRGIPSSHNHCAIVRPQASQRADGHLGARVCQSTHTSHCRSQIRIPREKHNRSINQSIQSNPSINQSNLYNAKNHKRIWGTTARVSAQWLDDKSRIKHCRCWLMLILFTEIFIVTFINVLLKLYFISFLKLRPVNLLFSKWICVCVYK